MKTSLIRIASVAVICVLFVQVAFAQDRNVNRSVADKYVISADAGGVNFVDGSVTVIRQDSSSGIVVKGDKLKAGDKVFTGNFARVELLLNPGSYARLGANSEFEFITTSLDNLVLKLTRGAAIFEVYAGGDFIVTVETPNTRFYLIESGVYRIDVFDDGMSRIEVRKGKAQVGTRFATKVKKGRAADVSRNNVSVSKFRRKDRDELETWSRARAKLLAKANASLSRKTALRSSLWNSFRNNRWNTYNSFGLWTYSSYIGGYCFLPFGYRWRSPYGFGLNRDIYYFRLPRVVYYSAAVNVATSVRRNLTGVTSRRTSPGISRTGNTGRSRSASPSRRVGPRPRARTAPRQSPVRLRSTGSARQRIRSRNSDQ